LLPEKNPGFPEKVGLLRPEQTRGTASGLSGLQWLSSCLDGSGNRSQRSPAFLEKPGFYRTFSPKDGH
jgi:hypothetical protein